MIMTQEEKAKRYDEAIKRAKSKIKNDKDHVLYEDDVIEIFPELKESKDERIRKKLIDLIYKVYANTSYITCVEHEDMLAWLEKQGGQKPAEWSEEDEMLMDELESYILYDKEFNDEQKAWRIKRLKSLKDRVQPQNLIVTDEELAQAKKESYNDALNKIEYHSGSPTFDDGWSAAIWYLKKRNAQPKNRWKPSDEQMEALNDVISSRDIKYDVLSELWEDLKKLRKE